jgi:DNA-binding Lrp family transcriptional regulator
LRKLTGYRDHTIRYFLQKAIDNRVISRRCFVNLNTLGYSQFQVYFSLASRRKEARLGVIEALSLSDKVSWLGELGGEFQYGVSICVKSIYEVWEFLDELSESFGAIFTEKTVAVRISLSYFGHKYLSSVRRPVKSMSYAVREKSVECDQLDCDILKGLTQMHYNSGRELARQLKLPQATLDYRVKGLKKKGVVVGAYYQVQAAMIGMQSFLVLLCANSISREFREAFLDFCQRHKNITLLIHFIGSWDFELVVVVSESREVTEITQEIYDRFGASINWMKSLPLFADIKVSEYPFA